MTRYSRSPRITIAEAARRLKAAGYHVEREPCRLAVRRDPVGGADFVNLKHGDMVSTRRVAELVNKY